MYRTILVPLDGSAFAEQALPVASELAARSKATLHLVLVHQAATVLAGPGEPVVLDPAIDERLRREELGYLASMKQLVSKQGPVTIVEALLEGPVAPAVAEYAAAQHADLVVMTTHGRGVFSRFWLGSVADRLVRQLEQPMLLIRPQALHGAPPPSAIHRLCVPLDGSTLSEAMIEPTLALAETLGAGLTLLRVVERLAPVWLPTPGVVPAPDTDQVPHRQLEAQRYLNAIADRLRLKGVPVETAVEVAPEPVSGIQQFVEREGMDLVAIATHGHGGPVRFLLGSVADKLVRGASVPVLVWRPREAARVGSPATLVEAQTLAGVW